MSPAGAPRCPKCAGEVRQGWRVCPACATPLERTGEALVRDSKSGAETETMFAASSASSVEEGRFPAGTVLAGRYRVLGLIGRGGMGEVYRAYDLILNQAVALKFLGRANRDEAALARFRNEVRVARQVSHPNVCRVYDIGFIEGFHFLSMEYLDGEDLASLLRRIGRLPQDKAIEFARKICAGLAAAHERGVLHRDLKPANIMVDGRGQVRITDFGLAALAQEVALGDIRSGTPAYMSPEQKAGKEVTTRSDLYSLGLVLYEMFTGKRRSDTQTNPSELVKDLDPAIERVILRCVEQDPRRRPSSALNVAMALPGGDPIAAALAAGETPSPEMVAASGEKEGFSARTAVLCFLLILLGAIESSMFLKDSRLFRIARIDIPPDALAFRSQEILKQLGYTEPPKSTAYGFGCCEAANLRYANRNPARRDAILASHQPPVIRFWYRQHRDLMLADPLGGGARAAGAISYESPPNAEPGMVRVALDVKGRLIGLDVRPVSLGTEAGTADWSQLFAAAGLDPARFTPTAPRELPPMPFDAQQAWTGSYAQGRPEQVHIEAAAWRGQPVYFSVAMGEERTESTNQTRVRGASAVAVSLSVLVFLCLGAALVARHNLRSGRGDCNGAAKIAGVSLVCLMFSWALTAAHVPQPSELGLLATAIAVGGFISALLWLAYIAVEPYMRRHWPDSLISWNRLLSGHIRDPLVASHILAGLAGWFAGSVLTDLAYQLVPVRTPEAVGTLSSAADLLAFLITTPYGMFAYTVGLLVLVVVMRLLTRRRLWIADILACILGAVTVPAVDFSTPYYFAVSATAIAGSTYIILWLIRRFGFVALLAGFLPRLLISPFVWGSWYTGRLLVTQLIPIAVAAWALWVVASAKQRTASESAASADTKRRSAVLIQARLVYWNGTNLPSGEV